MMQGSATRTRSVELISPKEMLIAMGIMNRAWKDCSSISGVVLSTVVTVVRKMARRRCGPADSSAARTPSPARRRPLRFW